MVTIRLGDEGCGSVDGQYNSGDDGAEFHVCEGCVVDGQGRGVPLLYRCLDWASWAYRVQGIAHP
jgi:hypothetical protein